MTTLHQWFKYIDDDVKVHRVFADEKPFKGKKVYFTDAAMYEEKRPSVKEPTVEINTAESSKVLVNDKRINWWSDSQAGLNLSKLN